MPTLTHNYIPYGQWVSALVFPHISLRFMPLNPGEIRGIISLQNNL